MGSLTEDPAFLATTFVVVDFETTTPTGHPAQPVEVVLREVVEHLIWEEPISEEQTPSEGSPIKWRPGNAPSPPRKPRRRAGATPAGNA